MNKIKVGIIGGAGYTAGELLRILIFHPEVEIVFIHSKSQASKDIATVHTDLFGDTDLKFSAALSTSVDLLFLCLGHGDSKVFLSENAIESTTKIIDLSQDFRCSNSNLNFVYGLPELCRKEIQQAQNIANPGCFATAIQLALLPLAKESELKSPIHIGATTGSTGAGQALSATSHNSWRTNNLSVYKAFEHQHLAEINQSLGVLQTNFDQQITFIPQRGAFARGIFSIATLKTTLAEKQLSDLYQAYYESHPFTHVSEQEIDLKQVVNTNKALLYLKKSGEDLMVVSAIDNLTKGASGQAVQNMNLMFGLDESTGLKLKAAAF
ncbi:N-acetyl-gamma-glutamyl-phosphate reductase [Flavobacterium sp. NKUCC04_CG]|uniref:N-acetyl-gamma-glutamyl-phosphate reductase n=1 Tax=Flavobacterium sp. NKUCC04_CG TaxID=2842121 RepID=UPI001C5B332F|nr:N-acetyl-gamma-glutamyl-phosphate reductase [Flavobacterium sp. NKUCC04_CG]MBW3518899.1 N-acetyl-gamma-glutamyl-phosphate reductase [Flavobacterium sp. NKUCC04_CG]